MRNDACVVQWIRKDPNFSVFARRELSILHWFNDRGLALGTDWEWYNRVYVKIHSGEVATMFKLVYGI
jgi:hypothetical protein